MLSMFPLIVVDACGFFFSLLFFHRSSFIIIEKRYKDSATEKNAVLFFFHFFNGLNDEVNELQPHTFFPSFLNKKKKEKLDIILILIYSFFSQAPLELTRIQKILFPSAFFVCSHRGTHKMNWMV